MGSPPEISRNIKNSPMKLYTVIVLFNPSDTKGFGTTSDTKGGGGGGGRANPSVIL